ncbi:MAG: Ig-like domain-containing protein [Bacteroidales bacterium]|nr:Ig-like domain-containing protein [Bacteroidales bacterium]
MKLTRFIPLLAAAALLAPVFFTGGCANTTEAPTGGPKDTIPPVIIGINPLPGAVRCPVSKMRIVFTFNEYVNIKNAQNIFLSPPLEKKPDAKMKGRNLVVTFPVDLAPNTTYSLSMTDAIADNNENNPFPGYTYVFSTGDRIDSLFMTGAVLDCNTLDPVKGATVMLYRDHADSAVFLKRPVAAAKTDQWGYFVLPHIADTLYRLYAVRDDNGNNLYDPDTERIAFLDSLVRPVKTMNDSLPELMRYDMTDTLGCQARAVEHELKLFREKPSKQYLVNKVRTSLRSAYITFMAPGAWIDSLWVGGLRPDQIISQFNVEQDSLEIWLNDRRNAPDTIHLFVNYRKTDSTGVLRPELEHVTLSIDPALKRTYSKSNRRKLKHEDTTCVFKLTAEPETVEQNGFSLEFGQPLISAAFDSLRFRYLNPRQKEFTADLDVERDSLNLRRYILRPKVKFQKGYEYFLKVPHRAFRNIDGFWSDSTEVKVMLPADETLSRLDLSFKGVECRCIVDMLDEKRSKVLRSYTLDSDGTLAFPYLKEGRYSVRVAEDRNGNGIIDTGSVLEHRQSERVVFVKAGGENYISVPKSAELTQEVDLHELFNGQR